jgi:hypothetical protein
MVDPLPQENSTKAPGDSGTKLGLINPAPGFRAHRRLVGDLVLGPATRTVPERIFGAA